MALRLPSSSSNCLRRTQISSQQTQTQVRHASLLRRPHRPYTFTQLVTLSDGSTFTQRTTSPAPVFKVTKDTYNHAMWQPSLTSLRNVEDDEAGRLRAFRQKFGRGWDVDGADVAEGQEKKQDGEGQGEEEESGSLMDLISGYSANAAKAAETTQTSTKKGAKK